MSEPANARQTEKAAAAFDSMNVTKKTGDQRDIARLLFKAYELHRRSVDVFGRLGKELCEQIVHGDSRAAAAANESDFDAQGLRELKPQAKTRA